MSKENTASVLSEVLKWLGWLVIAVQEALEIFTA